MRAQQGFTLIELLVVVSIIGTLATMSMASLNSARAVARDARRISDIRQVQLALEMYYFDHNGYPAATATLGEGNYGCLGLDGFTAVGEACIAPYMAYLPTNPPPRGAAYEYTSAGDAEYAITFMTETGIGGLAPGPHAADQNGVR